MQKYNIVLQIIIFLIHIRVSLTIFAQLVNEVRIHQREIILLLPACISSKMRDVAIEFDLENHNRTTVVSTRYKSANMREVALYLFWIMHLTAQQLGALSKREHLKMCTISLNLEHRHQMPSTKMILMVTFIKFESFNRKIN